MDTKEANTSGAENKGGTEATGAATSDQQKAQPRVTKGKAERGEAVAREIAAGKPDEATDRTGRYR